jgi:hypothetical protein
VIRVVVTVLLAAALLAASLPAVEDAAADRSERQLRAEIRDLDAAATDLLRSEEAVPGTAGARRSVDVTIPSQGIGAGAVQRLRISGTDRRYAFRVEGRDRREVLGTVPVHTLDGEPLVFREPGTHEFVLALVQVEGERRVVIATLQRVRNGALDPADGGRHGGDGDGDPGDGGRDADQGDWNAGDGDRNADEGDSDSGNGDRNADAGDRTGVQGR